MMTKVRRATGPATWSQAWQQGSVGFGCQCEGKEANVCVFEGGGGGGRKIYKVVNKDKKNMRFCFG
jgi:hypothetical protein